MRYDSIRLSGRHRAWFYGTFVTLFLSGALWWIFHNWLQAPGEFGPAPRPLEKWWLRLHGAAAMAALVVLGMLIPTHIRRAWRARRNRVNGVVMLAASGLLVVTGYGLYYLGGDSARAVASWLHTYAGLGFPLLLIGHIWQGRRTRKHSAKHP